MNPHQNARPGPGPSPVLGRDEDADTAPDADAREWFVSYDVTGRSIVLQRFGEDEYRISRAEAIALHNDLMAAFVAANEHSVLLGEEPNG